MKEKHIEQKWGFGMAPIKPEVQKYRHKCVQELLNIINNRKIDSNYEENSGTEFFSIVKGLFNRIKGKINGIGLLFIDNLVLREQYVQERLLIIFLY